jgi:hypothetical protein
MRKPSALVWFVVLVVSPGKVKPNVLELAGHTPRHSSPRHHRKCRVWEDRTRGLTALILYLDARGVAGTGPSRARRASLIGATSGMWRPAGHGAKRINVTLLQEFHSMALAGGHTGLLIRRA